MVWFDFLYNFFIIVGAIKSVSVVTPNVHKNKILDVVFKTVNIVALNIGRDKNAD